MTPSRRGAKLRGILGITGSPGTGKKSTAPMVAAKLGVDCISLNELVPSFGPKPRRRTVDVDTGALRRELRTLSLGPSVVYGHLLPYVFVRSEVQITVVLRCEPAELKRRLRSRGYPWPKVIQNVEAELLGVVSHDAFRTFGPAKTTELDTTSKSADTAALAIAGILGTGRVPRRRIEWMKNYGSAPLLRSLMSPLGA